MKKADLFYGKRVLTAGMLGVLLVFGGNTGLAAEGDTAALQETEAASEVWDAAGENPAALAAGPVTDADAAEKIVLADTGIESDQVDRMRIEAEWEDGESVYDVTFTAGGIEYEYLIREEDGMILEWEIDGRDIGNAEAEKSLKNSAEVPADEESPRDSAEKSENSEESKTGQDTLIGMERAREIALSDTGLDAGEVTFTKIKFEIDRRRVTYETEFYQGRTEYEYTIDAYSGEILEMERD